MLGVLTSTDDTAAVHVCIGTSLSRQLTIRLSELFKKSISKNTSQGLFLLLSTLYYKLTPRVESRAAVAAPLARPAH